MSSNQDQTAAQQNFEQEVAEYLAANPDFFERHRDLLADLRLPHESGAAVSLLERQLGVLREQRDDQQQRLQVLIQNAQLNEKLNHVMQSLVLDLLDTCSLHDIVEVVEQRIASDFNADAVAIKFMVTNNAVVQADPQMASWSTAELGLFEKLVNSRHSLCGSFDQQQTAQLFASFAGTIESAALIPLVDEIDGRRNIGLLAIGSEDGQRFRADMGTLFLDYLGKVVARIARRYLGE